MPDDQRPNVQKAKIVNLNNNSSIACMFNPDTFSLTRSIKWKTQEVSGEDYPVPTFGGGSASDLSMTLMFDSTASGDDVRDSYATLVAMTVVDESKKNSATDKGEPPRCRFEWGRFLTFEAVITKISEEFVMFKANGTPLRAKVGLTFKQVAEATRPQNPTTRTESRRIWVVHEGESLSWIAHQEYGNPAHWRHIAETNNLSNPMDLRPGQVLKLTPLP